MLKNILLLAGLLSLQFPVLAQSAKPSAPSGLMTDLAGITWYQASNGYAINSSVTNLKDSNVQCVLIKNKQPAFSWQQSGKNADDLQSAFQVLVADDPKELLNGIGNVWDSGKVKSGRSAAVLYSGSALKPNMAYYWKVRTWNKKDQPTAYSRDVVFYTAQELDEYKTPVYPIQLSEEVPLKMTFKNDVYLADFGRDGFGQIKLQLYSDKECDTVLVRLGEILDAHGQIERKPKATLRYAQYPLVLVKGLHTYKIKLKTDLLNTRAAAIKMPSYIGEVTPFRYCEIEGYVHQIQAGAITRLMAHYAFDDEASYFHSSDTTLNAIWDLCKYSMKATSYLGTYVDGDRERIPYEADAYINQLSHYAVDREYTLARHSHEYMITHPTWPTEWILQSVLMAWNDYLYTGDIRSARTQYENLKAKTLSALADSNALITTLNGKVTPEIKNSIHFNGELRDIVDWPHGSETDGYVFTKYNTVVNAFYYKALTVMSQLAEAVGNQADATAYQKQAAVVRTAFQKLFFDTTRKIYLDGVGTDHASLHANAFALALGLVDEPYRASVVSFLKSRNMACSVYGAQFLLDGLYNADEQAYGFTLLTQKTERSWYNMIKVGSTITLEAWDNKFKPNQDWNHAWGAAPANIIARKLMGVEPMTPGWSTFRIKPQLNELKQAEIKVPTIKGPIEVKCIQEANSLIVNVNVPGNTTCEVDLPLKGDKFTVTLDERKVKVKVVNHRAQVSPVTPGVHELKIVYLK